MELKEIQKRIIKEAIKDYEPNSSITGQEFLEGILFVLEHSKGNALYTKEQAEEISDEINCWLDFIRDVLRRIEDIDAAIKENNITSDIILEMNREKNELLRKISFSMGDIYNSPLHFEELDWFNTIGSSSIEVLQLIEEESKKYKKGEIEYVFQFIESIETIKNSIILKPLDEEKINKEMRKYYVDIVESILKDLHGEIEAIRNFIEQGKTDEKDLDELIRNVRSKRALSLITWNILYADPTFKIEDLFTEENLKTNTYLKWYKEQQEMNKEEIIKAHLKSKEEGASLKAQVEWFIISTINDNAKKIVGEYEKGDSKEKPEENAEEKIIPKRPKAKEFDILCQNYSDKVKKMNQKIKDVEKYFVQLTNLETTIIDMIKSSRFVDPQTNNLYSEFAEFNDMYIKLKTEEAAIISATELDALDTGSYNKYSYYPFDVGGVEKPCSWKTLATLTNVDQALQSRDITIGELNHLYNTSSDEREREIIKSIMIKEQGIMTSIIMYNQRADYNFDGGFYQNLYRTPVFFEEIAPTEDVEKNGPIVKSLKLNFDGVQSVGPNAFVMIDEEEIKISIVESELIIEFNKALREKLAKAKYNIDPLQSQKQFEENEIIQRVEERDGKEIWSYDLTHINTTAFNLFIVLSHMEDILQTKSFNLIRKGVINEKILNDEKLEPLSILTR